MKADDALFNWLQIRLVADARPRDEAALETLRFFERMLEEDHGIRAPAIGKRDGTMYHITYAAENRRKTRMFDREAAERLLADIEAYPQYFE